MCTLFNKFQQVWRELQNDAKNDILHDHCISAKLRQSAVGLLLAHRVFRREAWQELSTWDSSSDGVYSCRWLGYLSLEMSNTTSLASHVYIHTIVKFFKFISQKIMWVNVS